MTVIEFPGRPIRDGGWDGAELDEIAESLAPYLTQAEICAAEIGQSEAGDPQFYVVGPPPDYDCILCISRLGQLYVLEDGNGRLLFEHNSLMALADQAKAALVKRKISLVARATVLWCAIRQTFEEKVEPVLGEGEELLAHVAPQLAALA